MITSLHCKGRRQSIKQPCTGLCQPLHLQTPGAQAWNLVQEQSFRAGHDSWNPDGATKTVTGSEISNMLLRRKWKAPEHTFHTLKLDEQKTFLTMAKTVTSNASFTTVNQCNGYSVWYPVCSGQKPAGSPLKYPEDKAMLTPLAAPLFIKTQATQSPWKRSCTW